MAIFELSAAGDNYTGALAADLFSGPGGGIDTLGGGGGDDEFDIDSKQAGTIDGGAETDTVKMLENQMGDVTFSNVETLRLETSNLYTSVKQLNAFSSIVSDANPSAMYLFLQGAGRSIDFSTKVASTVNLQVEAETCTSAVSIYANAADAFMIGSDFNDTLVGGKGNDQFYGGDGNDQIDGSGGVNTAAYSMVAHGVNVDLSTGVAVGQGTDSLTNIQNVIGSVLNDRITGNASNNVLQGLDGNDIITGGGGADRLLGGTGADTFLYQNLSDSTVSSKGRDLISDFSAADGDKIYLGAIDANSLLNGNQAFHFIGTNALDGTAGALDYKVINGNAYVYGDVNGDKVADFSIGVAGTTSLAASSFTL